MVAQAPGGGWHVTPPRGMAEATVAHRRAGRLVGTRTHQPVPLADTPERQEPLCRAAAGWGCRRGGVRDWRVEGKRQERTYPSDHRREASALPILPQTHRWVSHRMSVLPTRCQTVDRPPRPARHRWGCAHEPVRDGRGPGSLAAVSALMTSINQLRSSRPIAQRSGVLVRTSWGLVVLRARPGISLSLTAPMVDTLA